MSDLLAVFVASTLRLATPLVFAASGEVVSERAGVLNLSLEGLMLSAAFAGAWAAHASGSATLGLLFGLGSAVLLAYVLALISVHVRANQLVVGIGFNIFALGATTFLYRELFGGLSRTQIPSFAALPIPGLSRLPWIGQALFAQTWLVYLALGMVALSAYLLQRTELGLQLRAAGEDPRAADQAGVDVARVRIYAVLYTGLCAGFAGCFLSLASISTFTEGMTNGAGYLAVTAVILGGWRSLPVFLACLLFGSATALQFLLPALGVELPTALLSMLPYLLALAAVAGLIGKSRAPAALSIPYLRGAK